MHLGFAYLLQCSTCSKDQLHGHLVKNLTAISCIVGQVKDNLDAANAASVISPAMDSLGDCLQRAPVNKDALSALGSEFSKLVGLHPLSNARKVFHRQAPIDGSIAADVTSVKLTQANLIEALAFAVG